LVEHRPDKTKAVRSNRTKITRIAESGLGTSLEESRSTSCGCSSMAEHPDVARTVVGSNPISHPIFKVNNIYFVAVHSFAVVAQLGEASALEAEG
jgi:hypothetical protein